MKETVSNRKTTVNALSNTEKEMQSYIKVLTY